MAASKPMWWEADKWAAFKRKKHTIKKVVPIITWRPWKPVATKKVEPYTESAKVKEASAYSMAWRALKYKPRNTVKAKPWAAWVWIFSVTAWCAHVTVTPEASKIAVLSRGIWNGLNTSIETGGQVPPVSIEGANLLWKKAQKKEKKKKISDTIKSTIPMRRPVVTLRVCSPWSVASRATSRHHWALTKSTPSSPIISKLRFKLWNQLTNPVVINIALKEAVIGQGLFSTKW